MQTGGNKVNEQRTSAGSSCKANTTWRGGLEVSVKSVGAVRTWWIGPRENCRHLLGLNLGKLS